MSPKLTPAAVTRIRTSPGPGTGTGASVIRRRSCGPFRDICCKARMVTGTLMPIWFLSSACLIEADRLRPGRPGENGKGIGQNVLPLRSGDGGSRFSVLCLCHVRPEPEHGDQSRVAEGRDPADACAGDGEH